MHTCTRGPTEAFFDKWQPIISYFTAVSCIGMLFTLSNLSWRMWRCVHVCAFGCILNL